MKKYYPNISISQTNNHQNVLLQKYYICSNQIDIVEEEIPSYLW